MGVYHFMQYPLRTSAVSHHRSPRPTVAVLTRASGLALAPWSSALTSIKVSRDVSTATKIHGIETGYFVRSTLPMNLIKAWAAIQSVLIHSRSSRERTEALGFVRRELGVGVGDVHPTRWRIRQFVRRRRANAGGSPQRRPLTCMHGIFLKSRRAVLSHWGTCKPAPILRPERSRRINPNDSTTNCIKEDTTTINLRIDGENR
jgi:hypothetical protein